MPVTTGQRPGETTATVKILRGCRVGDRDKRGFPKARTPGEICTLRWHEAIIVVGSKKAIWWDQKEEAPKESTFKDATDLSGKGPIRSPIPTRGK